MPAGAYTLDDVVAPTPQKGTYSAGDIVSDSPSSDTAGDLVSHWWDHVNPVAQYKSLGDTLSKLVTHPVQTLTQIGSANDAPRVAAADAFKRGDYVEGARHALNWLLGVVPGVGSGMEKASDEAQSGHPLAGVGDMLGIATNLATPAIVKHVIPEAASLGVPSSLTPAEQEAANFASKAGEYAERPGPEVPVPASIAVNSNKFIKGAQAIAAHQPFGAGVVKASTEASRNAMEQTAGELADQVAPAASEETSGATVAKSLSDKSAQQASGARAAYSKLADIESDPANVKTVQVGTKTTPTGVLDEQGNPITREEPITQDLAIPVDRRPWKEQLQPIYDQLKQQMPVAQQQASQGLKAIENIVHGDDFTSASTAESDLGAVKAIQRESVNPKVKYLAGKAIDAMAPAVDSAVSNAGQDAIEALQQGRALTRAKYATQATADQLPTEPVRLFNKLTANQDQNIDLLRDVQSKAPDAIPAVGRAYLQGLFDSATASEGVRPGPDAGFSNWNKLGDATKQILFPNPTLRKNIDSFMTLSKKLAENPNPSGSAVVGSLVPGGYLLLHNPVLGTSWLLSGYGAAKLLYSPRGVALLKSGMNIPLKSPALAASTVGQIVKMAGSDARPIPSAPPQSLAAKNEAAQATN